MAVYYDNTPKVSLQEASPLAFCIEAVQTEHKLFEAVLEADFFELYTESGLISLNEEGETADNASADSSAKEGEKDSENSGKVDKETNKNIWEKIKDMVEKAIKAIKKFFIALWERINTIFANDKKVLERYQKILSNPESYAGYKPKVVFADDLANDTAPFTSYLIGIANTFTGYINQAKNSNFDNIAEYKLPDLTKDAKDASDEAKDHMKKSVVDYFGKSGYTEIKGKGDKFQKEELDAVNKAAEEAKKNTSKDSNEEYEKISKAVKQIMKCNSIYAKAISNVIKVARGEYIKMGIYATQNKKKEENKENVNASFLFDSNDTELIEFYVDSTNDDYISECFSLAI